MPKKADTHIHKSAPGPPTAIAPVTPNIFPGPTRMAELRKKAAREEMPVSAFFRRVSNLIPFPKWVIWMKPVLKPIADVKANLADVLADVEKRAKVSFGDDVDFSLQSKVVDGKLYVDQGVIAGCAGGGFENICAAADILREQNIGNDKFTLNVYPASMPVYLELMKNGRAAELTQAGAVIKTAFCGPCFGAGDTPANNAFSCFIADLYLTFWISSSLKPVVM